MKINFGILCFLLNVSFCFAQNQYLKHFTLADGLPSNAIYLTLEDNKGFLWIATDQGVARFDGNRFQIFTTAQGLPDNDIYVLLKEKNGRLWAKGNNGRVAYFDDTKNKFINSSSDPKIVVMKRYPVRPYILPTEGIYFPNYDSSFLVKYNKWHAYSERIENVKTSIIIFNKDSSEVRMAIDTLSELSLSLYHTKKNSMIQSKLIAQKNVTANYFVDGERVYLVNNKSNKVIIVSEIKTNPLSFRTDTLVLSGNYFWHNFTEKYIMMLYANGRIDIIEKKSLKYVSTLNSDVIPFGAYNDIRENFWISSYGKGLFLFQKSNITNYKLPKPYLNSPWLCIAKKQDNTLIAGNYSGEVIESKAAKIKVYKQPNASSTDLQRNIILSQHKIFTFGEEGMFVNYTKALERKNNSCKVAYALNDTMILCGFKDGIIKINSITDKVTELSNANIEVNCIASIDKNLIYLGSIDGLHTYDLSKQKMEVLTFRNPLLHERIVALTVTEDSLVWVATATNGILVLRNEKPIFHLTSSLGLKTNNSLTITAGKKGQLWVGTNEGISIINYLYDGKIKIEGIQNLSEKDGLTSNVINQLFYQNDTMYAATENGISMIPVNISIPKFDIPIELTSVKINTTDTLLLNHYQLKPNRYNIFLQFAGIELTGHFKHAQSSFDEGITWSDLENTNLSLQRGSGEHPIWLRAVDVNGNIGTRILKLRFDIAKPYYETWWFQLSIILLILAISIYLNTMYTKRKQQQRIKELLNQQALDELEIQALKAQINPHFVFNCLNSIQGFIYDEDFENADLYLRKFSDLLRSTLLYSSKQSIPLKAEIDYIENYLALEKLRFGNQFIYNFEIQEEIDLKRIDIPAMLLQPYVENAIKHGVCNLKNKQGIISIKVDVRSNKLNIEIRDNGVGRQKAMEIKEKHHMAHESKGTELTQRRIELYRIELRITDDEDEHKQAVGTTVYLKIPMPL